ncbi:outer membrane protein transport protein [Psychrobacter sp. UBA3068]|uniref:outer membrane protein transport protein n=1 Tax=Psychrobacter sp. UBA3068 TaxID=1947349 RepID=UPI0025808ADD|nr:outer membrane protein transport protein [Psychrobacter sp. UBA3068]
MRTTFHLKTLAVAIAALSVASVTNAAGLDRSGQDITAFLQDGTYAEAVYTYIDADVSGYDSANNNPNENDYERGGKTGDIAESYDFFRYGVKADINDTFSVGVLYDEPFGAAAEYTGDSNFVSKGDLNSSIQQLTNNQFNGATLGPTIDALRDQAAAEPNAEIRAGIIEQITKLSTVGAIAQAEAGSAGENTNVEVRSQSLTGILGMKFGANKNFQIYGGPVAQRIESETKLRGLAYGPATGYTSNSNPDMDYGYIAGIAYSKPEIALKAALTYRSEIDHDIKISETYPLVGIRAAAEGATPEQAAAQANRVSNYEITTPKSVNFDFQTGINPTTLATAKVRWVPWSDFVITPPLYNQVSVDSELYGDDGLNLVEYKDDQWQVELGLAKRVAPALAISGTVGWDSGAGDPTTSLGPIDGYYSVGLGAKYNVTENWAVSAGGKYLWFGDAKGQLPTGKIVGDFQDNEGYVAGLKLSYQAK